jgi:hypothetical protein
MKLGCSAKMDCRNTERVASRLHLPKNTITEFKVTDMTYTYFIVFPGSVGRDSSVGIATRYGLDDPGIDSRWRARFFATVQAGPGAHPASYTMGTGSFPGVKRPGRDVDHPHHLVPRLKKEWSYTSTPPLGLRGLL